MNRKAMLALGALAAVAVAELWHGPLGATLAEARARAYQGVDAIEFADGFHRRDIGWRELERRP